MRALLNFFSVAAVTVVLAACGGGGGSAEGPLAVATQDATMNANPTTEAGVVNVPFIYPSGVPAFGTTAPTMVTFISSASVSPGSAPGFSITSGDKTASAATTFGSCIFKIDQSNFVAPSPLVAGNTITVSPCSIKANTNGETADGVLRARSVYLLLGTVLSSASTTQVSVGFDGQVLINGLPTGITVTVVHVTGA